MPKIMELLKRHKKGSEEASTKDMPPLKNGFHVIDPLGMIADMVSIAGSLEEAKRLIKEEIEKGMCFSLAQSAIDQRTEELWAQKKEAESKVGAS